MEILQLPILALQERIEQEMTERIRSWRSRITIQTYRKLDSRKPRAPTEGERELVVDYHKNQPRISSGWSIWTARSPITSTRRRAGP